MSVPAAAEIVHALGLEFVHFVRVSTDIGALDAERDAPSEQAKRNGVEGDMPREGVVLRPLVETAMNDGRVISKHKRDEERETKKLRTVVDPSRLEILTAANAIAEEWVTPTRLSHVLDKLGSIGIEGTREVITAMLEDVLRESTGEIADSREARQAISAATSKLFREHLRAALHDQGT